MCVCVCVCMYVQCTTSAFGDEPRRMLKVITTFRQTLQLPSSGRTCIGWKPCIEQTAGDEWDVTKLTGAEEGLAAVQLVTNSWLREKVVCMYVCVSMCIYTQTFSCMYACMS
jgi:hypothetical protein